MAIYTAMFRFEIFLKGPDTYSVGFGPFALSGSVSGGSSDSFAFNDPVSVIIDSTTTTQTFVGSFDGGIVVLDAVGKYTFLFNTSTLQTNDAFVVSTDPFTVCFLAGTRIATPGGESAIEDLTIGDLVVTSDGRTAPVRWIGVQSVVTVFADRLRTVPVRIMAGALGDGLPARDLFISPDHALMLDGVLVQAGALVDDTTISRMTNVPERFTYYHVELEDHALILAEGVPAETFVDNVTRRRFDNFAQYEAFYGKADATITEMDVPRVKSARQLPAALRDRLVARRRGVAA